VIQSGRFWVGQITPIRDLHHCVVARRLRQCAANGPHGEPEIGKAADQRAQVIDEQAAHIVLTGKKRGDLLHHVRIMGREINQVGASVGGDYDFRICLIRNPAGAAN
jgi:hypothetical protein